MTVRVLHVLPHAGGGGETYVDMLERLPGFAHERFFLSAGRTLASGAASIPVRWPRLAGRVRAADLVHCHGDVASVIALPLMRLRPTVLTSHGLHMLRRLDGPRGALMAQAVAAAVMRSRTAICLSEEEREELARIVRAPEKLRLIHNGVDPPPTIDEPDRTALRDGLGVGPDAVLGLFVGQLEPRKQPLLAALAARRVCAEGHPFVLAVAGDGPQAAELRAVSGEAVRVLGHRSDIPRLLAAADVYVHPAEREGMSYALLEAMSHGLAVVAADSSSNPEAVGGTGLLFPPGDEASLAGALIRLIDEPGLRASLGAGARARFQERFTSATFQAATAAVYSQALRAPGPAAGGARA